jgi:hypothetical protein
MVVVIIMIIIIISYFNETNYYLCLIKLDEEARNKQ